MFGLKNGIWKLFNSEASISSKVSGELTVCNVADLSSVKMCTRTHVFILLYFLFILCSSCKVNLQMLILQDSEEKKHESVGKREKVKNGL